MPTPPHRTPIATTKSFQYRHSSMHHTPLRLIIFDFDGVIAASIAMKAEAFRETFSFVPEYQDEIVQYHLDNGGMSRFVKFRYIYKEMLHEELSPEREKWLGERYAGIVRRKMFSIPLVPGALELLETVKGKIPLYIVSATPEEEMLEIADRRGLAGYFDGIYGSPGSKADCIREILSKNGSSPEKTLFIGDAPQDYEAARDTGVRFIARVAPGDQDRFSGKPGVERIVSDLHEIREVLLPIL